MTRFQLTDEQVARETRAAQAEETAQRAWRRQVRTVIAWCFLAQVVATLIGAAGFAVDDPVRGEILLTIGRIGVVLLPFTILILRVVEAHRRGDI